MTEDPKPTTVADEVRGALDARLAERDRAGAVAAALDAVRARRITVDDLYTLVLSPLLRDTGAAWQRGATMVWEEHFATAIVRTIVEALYPEVVAESAEHPRLGKSVVLACPAGESHDLGMRMLADRMSIHGWDAYFLGADTPTPEIVSAARAVNADLVALSVATHFNRMSLRMTMDELKRELPDAHIGVGGPAFAIDRHWPADELLSLADLGLPLDAASAAEEG